MIPAGEMITTKAPRRSKILVVDESLSEALLLARHLLVEGFEVVTAADSNQAQLSVLLDPPHCIILEVFLSNGLNGFQLCRLFKKHPALCHIPILFVTRMCSPLDRSWALRQGAQDFLTKPYDKFFLLNTVKTCVQFHFHPL